MRCRKGLLAGRISGESKSKVVSQDTASGWGNTPSAGTEGRTPAIVPADEHRVNLTTIKLMKESRKSRAAEKVADVRPEEACDR